MYHKYTRGYDVRGRTNVKDIRMHALRFPGHVFSCSRLSKSRALSCCCSSCRKGITTDVLCNKFGEKNLKPFRLLIMTK